MSSLPFILSAVLVAPSEDAMRTAAEHVAAEDFERARRVLSDAYAADPRPELLYSLAQVERIAGDCDEAQQLFERFAQAASEEDAADARRLSTQCTPAEPPAVVAPTEEPGPPPPYVAPSPEATARPSTPEPQPTDTTKPWSRRPLPAAMMGIGLGSLVAGAGLLASAALAPPTPDDAQNEGDYGDLAARNRRLSVAGAALTVTGISLAIGAGIIWTVLARRQRGQHIDADIDSLSIRF